MVGRRAAAPALVPLLLLLLAASNFVRASPQDEASQATLREIIKKHESFVAPKAADGQPQGAPAESAPLEARLSSERNFIRDIIERLHALDADIGKLVFNSSSLYSPGDDSTPAGVLPDGGGGPQPDERFTEVLADLDALQDEVSFWGGRREFFFPTFFPIKFTNSHTRILAQSSSAS